ncbi:MAG: isocitrate/isopropylmalate dehydrogenase family protein [Deltaproteobacteria bacterium]|jgi:3-isopropylmalate dehydrogenase|nr:isocitrate/isopropylmalate dehydrogenase family protein [Deltaproteobacteria bacterium]
MNYDIAVIPGDGIGPEVTDQALKVLNAASESYGFSFRANTLPYGANHYLKTGEILPEGGFSEILDARAILLGAVGDPRVPMGPLEQELLLALRFRLDLYLNLRPAKSFPNVKVPINTIPPGESLDILVVRENTEDFYMGIGGRGIGGYNGKVNVKRALYSLSGDVSLSVALNGEVDKEMAMSLGVLTAPAIDRVAAKAFQLAKERGESHIHLASKANALPQFYGFWDERVNLVAKNYPSIGLKRMNIDNLCYQLPRAPIDFGVILCPNLFGDIVSDLASSLIGGLGLSPSANVGDRVSMYEPVHGSAPDIAGTGKANPLAAILSGALMLNGLGEAKAAKAIEDTVRDYLAKGINMPFELGGQAPVDLVGSMLANSLRERK